jgi:hypothetical protein
VGAQANVAAISADANPILLKMLQALLRMAAGAAMPRQKVNDGLKHPRKRRARKGDRDRLPPRATSGPMRHGFRAWIFRWMIA